MMLITMPSDCTHSGIAVVMEMVRSRPDVAVRECPKRDDGKAIAPNRPIGMLREKVVEHPEESTRQ